MEQCHGACRENQNQPIKSSSDGVIVSAMRQKTVKLRKHCLLRTIDRNSNLAKVVRSTIVSASSEGVVVRPVQRIVSLNQSTQSLPHYATDLPKYRRRTALWDR
jgi:hypothetical protein